MSFAPAIIAAVRGETPGARTITLTVDDWHGHIAGQHVDVRLTAEDGYSAVRSYSIASSASSGLLEITVDRLVDGEVSPYLVDVAEVGDRVEVRGPAGGWFVWRGDSDGPVQLIGGGSGVVPLMAMIRSHGDAGSAAPFRLLHSVRSPASALFYDELMRRAASDRASRRRPRLLARDATGLAERTRPPGPGRDRGERLRPVGRGNILRLRLDAVRRGRRRLAGRRGPPAGKSQDRTLRRN